MVDTNIIVGIWSRDEVARERLQVARQKAGLVISPVVQTELYAHPGITGVAIDLFLDQMHIAVAPMTSQVWTLAGECFAAYAVRRREALGTGPRRIAADFLIGAHALVACSGLVTFGAAFYERNYPALALL